MNDNNYYRMMQFGGFLNDHHPPQQQYPSQSQPQHSYYKSMSGSMGPEKTSSSSRPLWVREYNLSNRAPPAIHRLQGGIRKPPIRKFVETAKRCDVCNVTLTSDVMFNSHINGKAHIKKVTKMMTQNQASNLRAEPSSVIVNNGLCEFCPKIKNLDSPEKFELHLKSAKHLKNVKNSELTLEESNENECKLCNVKFTSIVMKETHLAGKRHLKMVKENSVVNNVLQKELVMTQEECKVCDIKFDSRMDAIVHYKSDKHLSALHPYFCEICRLTFVDQKLLDIHLNGIKHHIKLYRGREPEGPFAERIVAMRTKFKLHLQNKQLMKVKPTPDMSQECVSGGNGEECETIIVEEIAEEKVEPMIGDEEKP